MPICVYFQLESMSNNRLKDIQEIQNDLEIVYKHPRIVSKKFQKYISSRTEDIPVFV